MAQNLTHRKLSLESGGIPRHVYGARPKPSVEEQMHHALHDLTIAATSDCSTEVPAEHRQWAYDLRRSRNRVCGGVLRFIHLLHKRGFPMEVALEIPLWLEKVIRATWSKRPVEHVVPLKKVG